MGINNPCVVRSYFNRKQVFSFHICSADSNFKILFLHRIYIPYKLIFTLNLLNQNLIRTLVMIQTRIHLCVLLKLFQRLKSQNGLQESRCFLSHVLWHMQTSCIPKIRIIQIIRGKYYTSNGAVMNANLNSSANILRKAFSDTFACETETSGTENTTYIYNSYWIRLWE